MKYKCKVVSKHKKENEGTLIHITDTSYFIADSKGKVKKYSIENNTLIILGWN